MSYVEVQHLAERFQQLGFRANIRSWNIWLGSSYLVAADRHGQKLKIFSERQGACVLYTIGELGWYDQQSA